MSHPVIAGIDLGTTNSCIAVVVDGQLTIIPVHGRQTMPSAVGIDPAGRLIIGAAAKNQEVSAPENTILSIKRHMGSDHAAQLGGKSYSPEEISALILGELKRAAEAHLGQSVTQAVITVPAFFDEARRKATQTAGQLAGLEVLRIINEPTAAALAYGAGANLSDTGETMLVYDLGGGTFDVSVVRVEKGVVEVKASFGDVNLGGDDFDHALATQAEERYGVQEGAPALTDNARRRLKGVMEQAKITLSDNPFASIAEEFLSPSHHLRSEFSREDYEVLIQPWLTKTVSCLRQAMAAAGVSAREIDKIMLVGGATRTPIVHALIRQELDKTPHHEIDPDLIVAMGAAIQGAALAGQPSPAILIDITAHTYSARVFDRTFGMICAPLIPRGTPLPVRRAEVYTTVVDRQTTVAVDVYQGEGVLPEENTLLGGLQVDGLAKVPAGNNVVIQFQLDLNGILTATATEKATGLAKSVTIDTRGQHRLNLDAARANLEALFADQDHAAGDGQGHDPEGAGADVAITPAAGSTEILAAAKSLRRRAEALITRGIAEKDAADIHAQLEACAAAIKSSDWATVEEISDRLSDLLFYLED